MSIDKLNVWIANTIPQVYDDSMSFYELLNAVQSKVNDVIDTTNEFSDGMQGYVNNQLNAWLNDGTLSSLVNKDFTGQTTNVYVDPINGLDINSGLTPQGSFKTLQTALDYLKTKANPILRGTWIVNLVAGTYPEAVEVFAGLISENPIVIQGPNVGLNIIPTAIISKGVGISAVGFQATYGTLIQMNNIKFIGFNGTTSSGGVVVAYGAKIFTSNVHTDTCYYGISGEHQSAITIPDGKHTNHGFLNGQTKTQGGGSAIRSLQQTNHYLGNQNATDQTSGFIIDGCTTGFFAQELSTGHVNWGTIKNCVDGVHTLVMSRANLEGVSFSGNTRDIRVDSNSHVFVPSSTVFDGTSQQTVVKESGGVVAGNVLFAEFDESYSAQERIFDLQTPNQTIGTTTATAFMTATLKYPHWKTLNNTIAQGRVMKYKIVGTLNGATNIKRINVRLNDGVTNVHTGLTFASSDTGSFFCEGEIFFTANGKQVITSRGARHLSPSIQVVRIDSTVAMTKDAVFTLEASVDDTTGVDNVLIDSYEVSVAG